MQGGIALWGVAVLLASAGVAALIASHRWARHVGYGLCLGACLGLMLASGHYLVLAPAPQSLHLPVGLPWTGAYFRLDPLAAYFLLVVNLGGAGASLFAIGYGRNEPQPARVLPFYPLFLAAMNLVVLADDAFGFLLAWELMSLASWALVVAHHHDPDNLRAGYIYILMASFGTLALLLAFGVLAASSGGYSFAEMRSASPAAPGLILLLALVGAGSKAGLVPLHVWLPLAHPAAPSHVSALMSGVMTKVAVYGFMRMVFDLNGAPAWWWSVLVITLAGISSLLGVLGALMQHDLKRLLAYHTVENIGIIFLGLGLALAFSAHALPAPAALALSAALFHVFNHSLFKSLLFFGSGAVLGATGERDMERLGGLIGRMPLTAFAFLTGAMAISALPPLNGFVSEWLTLQAILISPQLPSWALKLIVPAAGAMLALSAALAAACFVKAFGVTFLGRPRTAAAAAARETDRASLTAMLAAALLCLMAGVLPGPCLDALAPVVEALTGARMPPQSWLTALSLVPVAESRSSYNGLLVFVFVAAGTLLSIAVVYCVGSRAVRRGPAWDCGFPLVSPLSQYSADSFAQPIRRVFGRVVFQAREHVEMPPPGDARPARLTVTLKDLVWDGLYAPLAAGVVIAAERLNHLQFLTIRQYLSLVFVALVGLLLAVSIWT
ncbi:MAG TPA: hydrogenase 4 subunit B [Hyphomicrobiaceae bacterium]|nr:hydrogenase 4 subunit B [Hyphomicrobiaceae bacterium]